MTPHYPHQQNHLHRWQSAGIIQAGASNTTKLACKLHDSELFSRPEFSDDPKQDHLKSYGLDAVNRKATGTTNFVLLTSSPPVDRSKSSSGFQSQLGATTMAQATTTGKSAQTPAEAYKSAFDKLHEALSAILAEVTPGTRPYSSDSYLPDHLIEAAQQAIELTRQLKLQTPVTTQKTVTTSDQRCEYWTTTKTVRGAWVESDFFDVPVEHCGDSTAEFVVFRAMMEAALVDHIGAGPARDVLLSAGEKLVHPRGRPSQYWTALAFFNLVDSMLTAAAKHVDWRPWLDAREKSALDWRAGAAERTKQRNREIGQRAAATRKARRAAKVGAQ